MFLIFILFLYLIIGSTVTAAAIKISCLSFEEIGLPAATILTIMWPVIIILCIHQMIKYILFEDN